MRAILTYHSVDASGSPISIDPGAFQRHASWLADGPVQVMDVDELLATDPGVDAVAVTFDDGFVNFATLAWPLLRDLGLPATLGVVTDRTGTDNRWNGRQPSIPELPLLDWTAIGQLAEEGVTIASHTRSHRPLAGLEHTSLEDELRGSAERIEAELGTQPRGLVYPYGSVDDRTAAAAGQVYDWACTTELRPLRREEPRCLLPRLDMYYFRERGRLEQWGSGLFQKRIWLRANARRLRQKLNLRGA